MYGTWHESSISLYGFIEAPCWIWKDDKIRRWFLTFRRNDAISWAFLSFSNHKYGEKSRSLYNSVFLRSSQFYFAFTHAKTFYLAMEMSRTGVWFFPLRQNRETERAENFGLGCLTCWPWHTKWFEVSSNFALSLSFTYIPDSSSLFHDRKRWARGEKDRREKKVPTVNDQKGSYDDQFNIFACIPISNNESI